MLFLLGLFVGASFGVLIMGFVQGCEIIKNEPRCRCRGAQNENDFVQCDCSSCPYYIDNCK